MDARSYYISATMELPQVSLSRALITRFEAQWHLLPSEYSNINLFLDEKKYHVRDKGYDVEQ